MRQPALHIKANPNAAPREPVARCDWSSQVGAYEQAEEIRRYWQAKGFWVVINVVQTGRHPSDGLFGLKSNLIGGLPPA